MSITVKRERTDQLLTYTEFLKLKKDEKVEYLQKIDNSGEMEYKDIKAAYLNDEYKNVVDKLYPELKKSVFPRSRDERTSIIIDAPTKTDVDIEQLTNEYLSKGYPVTDMGSATIMLTKVKSEDFTENVEQVSLNIVS